MRFHQHTLANGLQVIGETNPAARSVALGFFVRTGSRDETAAVAGVSHFLEHMAFKGSDGRTAEEVNLGFDRIGADYNAFTSEENTVYHAAVLPEYLPRAVDLVADLLRPKLRQEDFDTEKLVIINEIGRYEDQPMWSAYDHARRVYFNAHRLGNSVLGSKESITALSSAQMRTYYRKRYVGPNILVSAAGAFDWDELVRLIEAQCGGWPSARAARTGLKPARGTGKTEVIQREKVAQQYVVLMSSGPGATSPLRHAGDLLSMAVGDDSGSRLYWELVDPGRADSAGCFFHEYQDTGVFFTSFSCEKEATDDCLARVHGVLQAVQADGISQQELDQARNKALSRLVRSAERPSGRMISIGSHWTYQGEYRSVDDELRAYEAVTLDNVRKVLDDYPLPKLTTLALGPLAKLSAAGA